MRRLITLLVLAAMMFPASHAQQAPDSVDRQRATYFLIDSSGSMGRHGNSDKAESHVSELLAEIRALNPDAPVSRTYFRAENQDLCWHAVEISKPVPASESEREFQVYGNDFTPLGSALEAAILDAGSGPADIFILSDEVQSPNCGTNICDVARTYLPMSNVTVKAIPVGEAAEKNNRLGCIQSAQLPSGAEPENSGDIEIAQKPEPATEGVTQESRWKKIVRSIQTFFEKWFWFFGVAFITVGALAFGWRQSDAARVVEDRTNQARSYQDQIRGGDEVAGKELNKLIAIAEGREEDDAEKPAKRKRIERRTKHVKCLCNALGIIGICNADWIGNVATNLIWHFTNRHEERGLGYIQF